MPRPTRPQSFALTAALLLGLTGLAAAQDAQTPNAKDPTPDTRSWTLAPRRQKDQTARFFTRFAMLLGIKSQDNTNADVMASLGMNLTVRYRVREVKPDGSSEFAAWSEGGQLVDAAAEIKPLPREPEDAPRLLTLDPKNRPLRGSESDKKDAGKGAASGLVDNLFGQTVMLANLHFLPLPEGAVKTGDTWKARYPAPTDKPAPPADTKNTKDDDASQINAEMTLLGAETLDDGKAKIETLKIKHVVTVPFVAETDDKGRALTPGKKAAGRVVVRITFTQVVNALPGDGAVVRSLGDAQGTLKFEGALARSVPGGQMSLAGKTAINSLAEGQEPNVTTLK